MTKARTLADNYAADISGITAGTGITGGGTSGTVTITNEMATTIDAKGDLVVGTGADTFGRLAVASTAGYVLTVDSAEATGLKWAIAAGGDTFAAGKNKIINGDFKINQRNHTSSTSAGYTFDRFFTNLSGGTVTHSVETFTPGTAPVTGYEGSTFYRCVTSGQSAAGDFALLDYAVESSRTFANQSTTISFWAKANSGTPKIAFELQQNFGSGGSPSASVLTYAGQITLNTSWTRYTLSYTIPSISGKTLGTTHDGFLKLRLWLSAGSTYDSRTGTLGVQSNTFDIWGVQWEAGSTATDFQTATGTLAGELAACQRYYFRSAPNALYGPHCQGIGEGSTTAVLLLQVPTQLRITAASVDYSALRLSDTNAGQAVTALVLFDGGGLNAVCLRATVASGLTQYRPYLLTNNNNAAGYVAVSAEL